MIIFFFFFFLANVYRNVNIEIFSIKRLKIVKLLIKFFYMVTMLLVELVL